MKLGDNFSFNYVGVVYKINKSQHSIFNFTHLIKVKFQLKSDPGQSASSPGSSGQSGEQVAAILDLSLLESSN